MKPRVVVLMPARNASSFLDEAMVSMARQTFSDFLLWILVDHSKDDTVAVAKAWEARDKRVQVAVFDRPQGIQRLLNHGIRHSTADLVARMDADDVSEPDRLALQMQEMGKGDAPDLLGTAFTSQSPQGRSHKVIVPGTQSAIRARLLFGSPFCHPSVILRRDALVGLDGPYDERLPRGEDYDLWCRMAPKRRLANIQTPLLRYRPSGNIGASASQVQLTIGEIRRRLLHEIGMEFSSDELECLDCLAVQHESNTSRSGDDIRSALERLRRQTLARNWCLASDIDHEIDLAWWRWTKRQDRGAAAALRFLRLRPGVGGNWKLLPRALLLMLPGRAPQ